MIEGGEVAIGVGAGLGGGEVGLEADEELAGAGGLVEDLGVERGLHEEDLRDVVGFLVAVFGKEGVEGGEVVGEGGGGAGAGLEFRGDAGDEGLEIGGGGGWGRRSSGSGGDRRGGGGGIGGAEREEREGKGEREGGGEAEAVHE